MVSLTASMAVLVKGVIMLFPVASYTKTQRLHQGPPFTGGDLQRGLTEFMYSLKTTSLELITSLCVPLAGLS